ncbi:MAG: hypothetical protein HGA46_10385 [Chlorobiaceae bacterium]|jgi:hypothetical protein|nr:hypothetical protein [Chlorobiaceae bacterium]
MNAAKRSIAIVVLAGMLLQINCVFVYFGLFYCNQKAIAATLCEKKTKDCCGHCFLQKKIAAVPVTQSPSSDKQTSTKTLEDLLNMMPGLLPADHGTHLISSSGCRFASNRPFFLPDGMTNRIFHPPNG